MLRRFQKSPTGASEAKLKFLDGDYHVLRPGTFVRCAVTGDPIPLEELRYWSVELQEPYKTPDVSLQRYLERHRTS